jgi:hypothetical protein
MVRSQKPSPLGVDVVPESQSLARD